MLGFLPMQLMLLLLLLLLLSLVFIDEVRIQMRFYIGPGKCHVRRFWSGTVRGRIGRFLSARRLINDGRVRWGCSLWVLLSLAVDLLLHWHSPRGDDCR